MEQEHYAETRNDSFFGNYLYDITVQPDHFFRKLNQIINWKKFSQKLIKLYKGKGFYGRPPFDPVLVLKMMLVAHLYQLSERQVEVYVNENIPAKYFVGLAVDQKAPDHSTLSSFRERLIKNGKLNVFQEMLLEIIVQAREKGVKFGSIQVVDSVHSIANVNTAKDRKRQKQGKGPRDPEARWGVKRNHKVKDEAGKETEQIEYFHGYKAHVSLNAENGLITSLHVTSGEANDGKHFIPLVEHDLELDLPVEIVTADKGYDDGENHYYLEIKGLHSAICLKRTRTLKKDRNKQIWEQLKRSPQYQQGLKERYKIERKFGEAKAVHGLGRCRYLGRLKFAVQAILTAMVLNLKRLVRLLAGVGFKTKCVATT